MEMGRISKSSSMTRKWKFLCRIFVVVMLVVGLLLLFAADSSNYSYDLSTISLLYNAINDSAQVPTTSAQPIQGLSRSPTVLADVSKIATTTTFYIRNDLIGHRGVDAEVVWNHLIEEATNLKSTQNIPDPGVFIEVGMFRAIQCLNAAQAGHEAHCVEPSRINFARVESRVKQAQPDVRSRMHLYNVAAGSTTGRILDFHSGGGTGDRVGHVDVWKMEQNPQDEPTAMTQVQEMRIDDIVMKQPNGAFLIKVDTQGFEPNVFSGLEQSLQTHKAKFILLEYWPKGMDLMTSTIGNCTSVQVLQTLSRAGYKLYQLPVTAHPAAPKEWKTVYGENQLGMPLDDFLKNCQWYYDLEKRFPSEEYKMGYWSDVLAVAPNIQLARPTTALGKLLFPM